MAALHTNEAAQAVHHAAVQHAGLNWLDQATARQVGPLAEAVVNMLMIVYYQAETGRATPDDFREALDGVRKSLTTA